MRKATKDDKELVTKIITETFKHNPGVNWLLKKSGNQNNKIKRLADFAFFKCLMRAGVFISSNGKGVALCYKFNLSVLSFTELFYQLRFAFLSVNLKRLPKVLKREAYRKSIRPKSGNYLYYWFLGVLPKGQDAVYDLRDGIFDYADRSGLPIYLETAVERNKYAYERFGFETYHFWEDPKENIRFWFLKREPKNNILKRSK